MKKIVDGMEMDYCDRHPQVMTEGMTCPYCVHFYNTRNKSYAKVRQ